MKHLLYAFCLSAAIAWADGHGPAFGYGTAVLGAGDTSVATAFMWRSGVTMLGPMVSYGVTGDIQLSVSSPFHLDHGEHPVGRFMGTMPGNPEVEVLGAWRFHHRLTGVGTRWESTLYLGTSVSTQLPPRTDGPPLRRAPGFYAAAATGHISRRYYVWAGGGYERYASLDGTDHQGSSLLGSFVLGWRPPLWDMDYPRPDLRFFWESTGEWNGYAWRVAPPPPGSGHSHDVLDTTLRPQPVPPYTVGNQPNSGGRGVYSGPTLLLTYRSIAFQGGVEFAVWRRPNGTQPADKLRAVAGVAYFFFRGRK